MKIADYIEGLVIPQGRLAGTPFQLMSWQRRFLKGAFSQPGSAALSVGRGNGKTVLMASILAATVDVDGPLVQENAEAVLVASSYEQARVAFAHMLRFLQPSIDKYGTGPRGRFRIEDSTARCRIQDKTTGASVRVLGSDPRRAHGVAPSLILFDEMAQFPPSQLPRMLAALETSMGKIPDARMLAIGTRPASSDHPFSRLLNGGAGYSQVHAADDEKDPPFQRRTWLKSNPSLPIMPDLEAAIRREADLAKRDPDRLAMFKALRLNTGTSDSREMFVFDPVKWQELEGNAPMIGAPIFGADIGTNASQSAIAAYWPMSGRLQVIAAFPSTPSLTDRGIADGVGDLYVRCHRRGELLLLGEKISDIDLLLQEAYRSFGVPIAIVADQWRLKELDQSIGRSGIPPCTLIDRRQGWHDGGDDIRSFREALLTDKVVPVESLLMRSAVREGRVIGNPAGWEKLSKGGEGGRRNKARDDALAASVLAVAIGYREAQQSASVREFEYAIV